jgi:hypothetical protein
MMGLRELVSNGRQTMVDAASPLNWFTCVGGSTESWWGIFVFYFVSCVLYLAESFIYYTWHLMSGLVDG